MCSAGALGVWKGGFKNLECLRVDFISFQVGSRLFGDFDFWMSLDDDDSDDVYVYYYAYRD